jgi:hypothetical protein
VGNNLHLAIEIGLGDGACGSGYFGGLPQERAGREEQKERGDTIHESGLW